MMSLLYAILTAAVLSPLLVLGIGCNAERPAGWRERARLMGQGLAYPFWRLLAVLPPGRRHERNARRELGMHPLHPERVTWPGTARERRLLDRIQAGAWPEGEWTDVIRYRDGAS